MTQNNESTRPALSDRVRSLRLGDRDAATPPRSRWLPWIVSFVLLLTTVAFGYRAYRVGPAPASDATSAEQKAARPGTQGPTSSVAAVGEVVLQAKGYVVPLSLVQVSPKVGGQLVMINKDFEEGRKFKKGDLLAKIDRDEYQAEYDQAHFAHEAAVQRYEEVKKTLPEEVAQAEAELAEARQTATQHKLDFDRTRRLTQGAAMTQRDLEQIQYVYESSVSRIRRLEAAVRMVKDGKLDRRLRTTEAEMKQARAVMEKAKLRLDYTEVKAPISGTILTKKAELGNIVNPSAFSSGISASLCDMADLTRLEIDLSIQERDIASVKKGQECQIMPEAYQNDKDFLYRHPQGYRGRVSRLMPTADRGKGAIPVRVRIDDGEISDDEAGTYLRQDMSALVSFRKVEGGRK